MFGKLGAEGTAGGSNRAARGLDMAHELCFRLDLTKTFKVLIAGLGFLAVGGWLFLDELQYWNEGFYSKWFFLACVFLVLGAICLPMGVRDLLRRDSVFLRLTPRGLTALGWADELRWSEIVDFSIYTQRVNGVVSNRTLYAVSNKQVMKRVCPSLWQRLSQVKDSLSAQPGLRIPVDRIAGDAQSVGELMYVLWSKYK